MLLHDQGERGQGGQAKLLEDFCTETSERVVLHGIADLDRVAADLAVFDIGLTSNREVENHRIFSPQYGHVKKCSTSKTKVQQVDALSNSHCGVNWQILPERTSDFELEPHVHIVAE
jgi:hypothetical protein